MHEEVVKIFKSSFKTNVPNFYMPCCEELDWNKKKKKKKKLAMCVFISVKNMHEYHRKFYCVHNFHRHMDFFK